MKRKGYWLGKKRLIMVGNKFALGNKPNQTSFKKGIISTMKGKHHTEETKQRISLKNKGKHFSPNTEFKKGYINKFSKKTRKKISLANKGRIFSEETKRKISMAHLGKIGHWKGKSRIMNDKWKKKIGLAHKGSKSHFWKGGISSQTNKRISTFEWNKIRRKVYQRDDYICQDCGSKNIKLYAHHILPYFVSQDDSLKNLVTLCNKCHPKKDWRYKKNGF